MSVAPESERERGLEPQRVAGGAVAYAGFALVFQSHEPSLAAVVLDRRPDRKGTTLVIGNRRAALLVVADLLVQITPDADHPAITQAPPRVVVDDEFVART